MIPAGLKFSIDISKIDLLVKRRDKSLGEAFIADIETKMGPFPNESYKRVAISAFEAGYACAISNFIAILEGKADADNAG